MTLIKRNQEPKPNRNYDDWCYPDYDDDVADGLFGKIVQFIAAVIVFCALVVGVYILCK